MALSTEISLEDVVSQFRGLNLNEPETWPAAPRILFMILAAVVVIGLGWQLYWSGKFDERDAKRNEQQTLKSAYQSKLAQVVNLDARRRVATVPLAGMPHLGSGITFDWNGTRVLATTNLKQGLVTVIDTHGWKTVRQIATPGPGFFLRSHENTPFAWVDAMMSPARDTMLVIDKRTLEVVRTLRPAPGRTVAHVAFSHDGRYALVSLWEDDGALIVYDAATLQEVKRLPMRKPVGKYNVGNKLARSEGTSH